MDPNKSGLNHQLSVRLISSPFCDRESSNHEQETETMEPRVYMSDSHEPAASDLSIGEYTAPLRPAAL